MSYVSNQINQVIKENSTNEFKLRLVIKGQGCSTKNINISVEQAQKIRDILEEIKEGDRVALANNTSIVCGTVRRSVEDAVADVVWDDVLYYGGNEYEGWYGIQELVKIE